ncbi:MAG: glucosaminidase domain-containing protein [Chloroflexia bacterium]
MTQYDLEYSRKGGPATSEKDDWGGQAARNKRATGSNIARQDSGLIKVYDDLGSGERDMNASAFVDDGWNGGIVHRPASAAYKQIPIVTDPYDSWSLDEEAVGKAVRRIATPGAWIAVGVVVALALAFVFVTPAFAGVGGAISRYSDGAKASVSGVVSDAPVIDASTPEQAQVQSVQQVSAPAPEGSYSLVGGPSISVGQIEKVLNQYGSPAAGMGQKLYDLGVQYGIDPAYALAFFVHESGAGTQGVARTTKSLGNIRWTEGWDNFSGYRKYASWEQGFEDWYKLITDLYINQWGLKTVDAIIPVYAPSGDNNSPPTYIASVKSMVDDWRGK